MVLVIPLKCGLDLVVRNLFAHLLHGNLDVVLTDCPGIVGVELLKDCIQLLLTLVALKEIYYFSSCSNELAVVNFVGACGVNLVNDCFSFFLR